MGFTMRIHIYLYFINCCSSFNFFFKLVKCDTKLKITMYILFIVIDICAFKRRRCERIYNDKNVFIIYFLQLNQWFSNWVPRAFTKCAAFFWVFFYFINDRLHWIVIYENRRVQSLRICYIYILINWQFVGRKRLR